MSESFVQFLATIIEQCLGERHMQPPLVVRTVGDNGNVLVANINERSELVVLTRHCENDTFTLPLKITIVGQDSRTARLVIERDGSIGRLH
jgi:hypothetical protein